jgi:hypothetical protein
MPRAWFAVATVALFGAAYPGITRAAEPAWVLQYFHDVDESEPPSPTWCFRPSKGFASGVLEEDGQVRPTLVVTRMAGRPGS